VPTSNAEGYRLTVDLRQVHQRTEPTVWPMKNLESCSPQLAASACYASAGFSKCYWPLALDEDSHECQSFAAPDGVYPQLARWSPAVLQGCGRLAARAGMFPQRMGRPRRQAWRHQNGHLLARGPVVRKCGIQGQSLARPDLRVCPDAHATTGDGGRLAAACVRSAVPSYAQVKRQRWKSYSTKFTNAPAAERGSGPQR
jgi:hypothetical protein